MRSSSFCLKSAHLSPLELPRRSSRSRSPPGLRRLGASGATFRLKAHPLPVSLNDFSTDGTEYLIQLLFRWRIWRKY